MKIQKFLWRKALPLVICFLFSSLFNPLHPVVKGSETVLSVEPYFTFPAADGDNKMLGFGWFKNGFALEDVTTSCTFDSVFPVSGTIALAGGSLYLNSDLKFQNVTHFNSAGSIYGNGYVVDFCSTVTSLGCDCHSQFFDNANMTLQGDLVVSGSITFRGDCLFDGKGKKLTLDDDGYLLIDSSSSVTF